jgi:bifunctional non-homologous end joining protein LigD
MSLKEYVKKRNFGQTAEPRAGRVASHSSSRRFVIQKHAASRLHYDFRLELDGTLKSWAVPKGVPYKKGERRLAVQVEDHPISYINFEGTIPAGQYGGGTVMVWDQGTFEPLTKTPSEDLAKGKLHVVLKGKKLKGEWYLVQLRGGDEWLLIKGGENLAPVSTKAEDTSALSGKSMAALTKGAGAVWHSNRIDPPPGEPPSPRKSRVTVSKKNRLSSRTGADDGMAPLERGKAVAPFKQAAKFSKNKTRGSLTPDFIEPMKALLVAAPPPGEWLYEIKFDGFRAIAFRDRRGTRLRSRNDHDFAGKFPEVVEAIAALKVKDVIIDGEVVALDAKGRSSFQLLQAHDLGQERPPLIFYAFDLLQLDGENLRDLPLIERTAQLAKLLRGAHGAVRLSKSLGSDADPLLKQAKALGLEGLIGKRPQSVYTAGGRNGDWIKLKLHHEQEFVIGGYTLPAGSRPYFGALLVGVYEKGKLKFAGKVGTGFDAKLLESLHGRFQKIASPSCPFADLPEKRSGRYGQGVTAAGMKRCHWLKPSLVAQLKFTEWTRDDRLRHPVFLGLREDKAAAEVTRERAKS